MNTFETKTATDLVRQFSNLGSEGYILTLYRDNLDRPCGKLERVSKRSKLGTKLVKHIYADTEEKLVNFFSKKYDEIFTNLNTRAAKKAAQVLEQEKLSASIKEGDMFYTSWGYDQTNMDFYVVVKKTSSRGVMLQQVGCDVVETVDWCSHKIKINKSKLIGSPFRKLLRGDFIPLNSFSYAWKFEDENKIFVSDTSRY